jgi:hypothetical protein
MRAEKGVRSDAANPMFVVFKRAQWLLRSACWKKFVASNALTGAVILRRAKATRAAEIIFML